VEPDTRQAMMASNRQRSDNIRADHADLGKDENSSAGLFFVNMCVGDSVTADFLLVSCAPSEILLSMLGITWTL
jgi:hypothetical protein